MHMSPTCICTYRYIHVYMHICVCACLYMHVLICMYALHIYIYSMHTYIRQCIYVCICYICICVWFCAWGRISLCNSYCPRTQCRKAWPATHRDLLAGGCQVLGFKIWVTMPSLYLILQNILFENHSDRCR